MNDFLLFMLGCLFILLLLILNEQDDSLENFTSGSEHESGGGHMGGGHMGGQGHKSKAAGYERTTSGNGAYRTIGAGGSNGNWLGAGWDNFPYAPVAPYNGDQSQGQGAGCKADSDCDSKKCGDDGRCKNVESLGGGV